MLYIADYRYESLYNSYNKIFGKRNNSNKTVTSQRNLSSLFQLYQLLNLSHNNKIQKMLIKNLALPPYFKQIYDR